MDGSRKGSARFQVLGRTRYPVVSYAGQLVACLRMSGAGCQFKLAPCGVEILLDDVAVDEVTAEDILSFGHSGPGGALIPG